MLKIYFARHGQTEWNKAGIMQGYLNSDLSTEGREQAKVLADSLKDIEFDHIYSSDLGRAYDTAMFVAKDRGMEVEKMSEFKEKHFGVWQGMKIADVLDQFPEQADAFFNNPAKYDHEEIRSESLQQALDRMIQGVDLLREKHDDETILVVSHGTVLKLYFNYLEGKHINELRESEIMSNSSFRVVEFEDKERTK